ncbi:unnamed protein product [Protopolystoma xenopodis]|uniref:Uncharacterized protein n=1 Tax=Protopolystoma xenopodis TaxID=117903 RepID=A0A3S5AW55_9PLAT|nr:unnamed protein product [Protopolystoma xenopodis]
MLRLSYSVYLVLHYLYEVTPGLPGCHTPHHRYQSHHGNLHHHHGHNHNGAGQHQPLQRHATGPGAGGTNWAACGNGPVSIGPTGGGQRKGGDSTPGPVVSRHAPARDNSPSPPQVSGSAHHTQTHNVPHGHGTGHSQQQTHHNQPHSGHHLTSGQNHASRRGHDTTTGETTNPATGGGRAGEEARVKGTGLRAGEQAVGAEATGSGHGGGAAAAGRYFDDMETQMIVKVFRDFFNKGSCPSLSEVRRRIVNTLLQGRRNATSVRAKVKRLQTSGRWTDFTAAAALFFDLPIITAVEILPDLGAGYGRFFSSYA